MKLNPAAVSAHMVKFATQVLAVANDHAHFHAEAFSAGGRGPLSVVQAAHAAELFVKARIAQEHPLLLFKSIPKAHATTMDDLLDGVTYDYNELPNRLLQTTGVQIDASRFNDFGKLRNKIQHFMHPPGDLSIEAFKFIYEVIDPFINEMWGLCAIDYDEDTEEYIYLMGSVVAAGCTFHLSKEAAAAWPEAAFYGPVNARVLSTMNKRANALGFPGHKQFKAT